jgi:hypothetical protein
VVIWCGRVVRRLWRAGSNQEEVLLAFDERDWEAPWLDNPFDGEPGAKRMLYEAIRGLNDSLAQPSFHFFASRGGVGWAEGPRPGKKKK